MSKRVLIPIADGSEDLEAVTLIDVLRRAEFDVVVASVEERRMLTCARGTRITADTMLLDVLAQDFDLIVLPGGIGTLEEAVEMLSWARLGLHAKPMAFLDEDGFWAPFFELMNHIIDGKFTPESFRSALVHESTPELAISALRDRVVAIS